MLRLRGTKSEGDFFGQKTFRVRYLHKVLSKPWFHAMSGSQDVYVRGLTWLDKRPSTVSFQPS